MHIGCRPQHALLLLHPLLLLLLLLLLLACALPWGASVLALRVGHEFEWVLGTKSDHVVVLWATS